MPEDNESRPKGAPEERKQYDSLPVPPPQPSPMTPQEAAEAMAAATAPREPANQ